MNSILDLELFYPTRNKPCEKSKNQIQGRLEFTRNPHAEQDPGTPFQKSDITRWFNTYPLRLMIPSCASNNACQWVYTLNFGGGLVSGDNITVEVTINDHCCVLWTSQSFPKVYKSTEKGPCYQHQNFQLGHSSLLAVLSDPIVCYRGAEFRQTQDIFLSKSSNLVFLDWFTAGRITLGEWWSFKSLFSSVNVFIDDKLVVKENLELSNTPNLRIKDAMGDFGIVGTCLIMGPYLKLLSEKLTKELNSRNGCGVKLCKDVLFTASPLFSLNPTDTSDKEPIGCILKLAAVNTSLAYEELSRLLSPLTPIFGDDPFKNKF